MPKVHTLCVAEELRAIRDLLVEYNYVSFKEELYIEDKLICKNAIARLLGIKIPMSFHHVQLIVDTVGLVEEEFARLKTIRKITGVVGDITEIKIVNNVVLIIGS